MEKNILYKKTLDNAIASVEIEGYVLKDFQKDVCLDFVSGKISREDFVKLMLERCGA